MTTVLTETEEKRDTEQKRRSCEEGVQDWSDAVTS